MNRFKNWRSKIMASVLSLVVMFSLVQFPVYAASGEVWVNGENIINDADNIIDCGNGTASYDVSTNTLTLNNAQITQADVSGYGIHNTLDTDFNIILLGSNSIDIQETTGVFAYTESNMTFSGGGSLDIKAKQNISNHKNITFDNVTITATGSEDGSIVSDGNVIIRNGSDITCRGTYFGFNVGGDVTISESDVTATASLDNMNAFFIIGAISIENESTVTATSHYPALYSQSNINIENSDIVANSTGDWGIWSQANLTISGDSDVTAKGATGNAGGFSGFNIIPKLNESVEVFVGTDADNVTAVQGSPFSAETNLKALNIGNNNYFHSKTHIHTYETTLSKDANKHWYASTCGHDVKKDEADHTFEEWVVDTEATETEKGSKHRDCSVCEHRETEEISVVPHTHTPATDWTKNETSHWHECTANDGHKMDLNSHTFGAWVIDTEATETEKGSKHRDCSVCGQRETEEIPVTGETPAKPTITVGGGFNYQISADKDMTLTCSGKLEDLIGVHVDGKLVDPSNYILKSGSTILTLKASYLDTLSAGKHTLTFQYKDNVSAETNFTITAKTGEIPVKPSSPQTGDTSNTMLYLGLIVLSGCVAGFGFKKKKSLNK